MTQLRLNDGLLQFWQDTHFLYPLFLLLSIFCIDADARIANRDTHAEYAKPDIGSTDCNAYTGTTEPNAGPTDCDGNAFTQ